MPKKVDLPPRCPRCAANDWPYARGKDGVERCDCPRGIAMAAADAARGRRRTDVPGITVEQATIAVARLGARMLFVPVAELDAPRLPASCWIWCVTRRNSIG